MNTHVRMLFLRTKPYWPYILLTMSIFAPLLVPGYILTLDLVFAPELRMPSQISNDFLWHAGLHVLNFILPSQIIEKMVLISIPLLASIGMHQLLCHIRDLVGKQRLSWQWAMYAASIFYAVNPFTYSRFMAGQYAVLLGYALIPFFVRFLLQFLAQPGRGSLLRLVALTLGISIISIHTLGELALLVVAFSAAYLWHTKRTYIRQVMRLGAMGVVLFATLSSYWLIPLALGKGNTAETIGQFDAAHAEAFATVGQNALATFVNVLQLQGFWAEEQGLYLMPQDGLIGWGTVRLLILALIFYGIWMTWRSYRRLAAALTVVASVAVLVALGTLQPVLTNIGYREPHKFVGLVAFAFAVFIAFGAARLLFLWRARSLLRYQMGASTLLLIIVLFTPTMYWGFAGQLTPREYPQDWQRLNARLNQDHESFQTLFLPWHQYMHFHFAGRVIANPAEKFFDKPMIVSNNPELGPLTQPADDPTKYKISELLQKDKNIKNIGEQLAKYHVKYIMLAHDLDHEEYNFLDKQSDLRLVQETDTLRLYQNTAFKE